MAETTHKVRKRQLEKATEKECTDCGKTKKLTTKYWRKFHLAQDGYEPRCKACSKNLFSLHYVKFTQEDLARKGESGVLCPLYSDRCGECIEGAPACFRIDDGTPDKEYPITLFED